MAYPVAGTEESVEESGVQFVDLHRRKTGEPEASPDEILAEEVEERLESPDIPSGIAVIGKPVDRHGSQRTNTYAPLETSFPGAIQDFP